MNITKKLMSIKLLSAAVIFLQITAVSPAIAESKKELLPEEVVTNAKQHYPKILSYYEKVSAAEGSVFSSLGFFDVKLKQKYTDNIQGFYDGKTNDILLEKELGFLGSKLYGGYRKSFGSFPVYDGDMETNRAGEYRIGGKVSLLKNSSIDENRLNLILSKLNLSESKIQLEIIKRQIEIDAIKAYWKWVGSANILHIYEELYQLSVTRQTQLEEKLRKGDVAQILVVENKKNILRRKSALAKAKQEFENNALYLSLFWRSEDGKPLLPKLHQVPKINFILEEISAEKLLSDINVALVSRPELKIIKIKKEEVLNQIKYSENLFKPELDIDFSTSKDLGSGPKSRAEAKSYAGIEFSLPLQQREAKGKSLEYQSKLTSLKYEEQLSEEKITTEIEQIKTQINSIVEIHNNLSEEAKLASLLEISEREKFKQGASNFFLVNLREQDTAASKSSLIENFEKYQSAVADYKMAIFTQY